jgi:hypothetical protein
MLRNLILLVWLCGNIALSAFAGVASDPLVMDHPFPLWVSIGAGILALFSVSAMMTWMDRD